MNTEKPNGTAHTQGPWLKRAGNDEGSTAIWGSEGNNAYCVAMTKPTHSPDVEKANAALIAAAPELLQAAKWALQGQKDVVRNYTVIEALEQAIAHAEGRK